MRGVRDRGLSRRSLAGGVVAVSLLVVVCWQAVASAGNTRVGASASSSAVRTSGGCQGVKRGGTFTYGVDQDVTSFDAANTQDNGSLWADMNIYDQLVRLNPAGTKVVPDLASSWQVKQGGKVIVFHLRHDARFYDGTPVTAADVKFSYDRTRSPKSVVNWTLEAIKSDRAIDKYTFEVTLKKPWAPFLNDITLWGASIMSKQAVLKWGKQIGKHPVGSGPFYVSKWVPGQYVLLKRNPYYWEKDACGNRYPYLDAVKLAYTPNDNTRVVKLEGGALDAIVNVPYNLLSAVGHQPNITAATTPQFGIMSVSLNQSSFPPFKDQKIVQAMNYAIDRNAIVKAVFFGHAAPASSPIEPGLYFHTSKYGYSYDLQKAKALMQASTNPKGFSTTLLTVSGDSIGNAVAVIMQSELKQIGIDLKIQALDSTTEFERQQKKQFEMAWLYGTSDNLDPNANMLFCCVSDGGADSAFTGWKNPAADALFRRTQTAVVFSQRNKLMDQWQKMIMAEAPFMWLIYPTNHYAYRDQVHNFSVQNTAHWPLWVVWKS